MSENDESKSESPKANENDGCVSNTKLWPIFVAGAVLFLTLLVLSIFLPSLTERVKFFTVNALSLFVLVAIVVQVYIYRRQWEVMQQQMISTRIAERGYIGIKTISLVDLEVGKIPYIRVYFLNGGRTPLWNVYFPARLVVYTQAPEDWPPKPDREPGGFMPAGTDSGVNYSFLQQADEVLIGQINEGIVRVFLFGEAWFEDCWGELRSYPFRLIYRPKDQRWEEYKKYAAENIQINPPRSPPKAN